MTTTNLKTIEALEAFLEGNQLAVFAVPGINLGINLGTQYLITRIISLRL
jgi:hypothetical protein